MTTIDQLEEITEYSTDLDELVSAGRRNWAARSARGVEVLRFDEGHMAMSHPDLEKAPSFLNRLDRMGVTEGRERELWEYIVPTTEGDRRNRLRIPLAGLLRPSQINKLKDEVAGIAASVLDTLGEAKEFDFQRQVAWYVPPRMYCHLVSAPDELADTAARLSDDTLSPLLTEDHSRRDLMRDTFFESFEFVREHIDAKRGNLGDDFTSVMIRQQEEGLLTETELIAQGVSILQGSIDNTVTQLGLVLYTLLEDRTRWEAIVADPSKIPAAIEECIRLFPRFNTIFRLAGKDVELNGLEIPEGTWVYVSARAGHRDETVFADADTYNIDRPTWRPLQFGNGQYNCLGQNLARLEISEVLKALVERYPTLHLNGDAVWHETNAVTEMKSLPVAI